jgi:hypothetical protein
MATFPHAASANSSSDPQRADVFALIGDRYHPADYLYNSLKTTLVDEMGLSVDFRLDPRDFDPTTLSAYKLVLMLHDGKVWPNGYGVPRSHGGFEYWMTPEQGRAIKEFVSSGGAAFFLHDCTYIAPSNRDFRDVLGAVTLRHPPVRPFKVKITKPEHPIMRGVKDFVIKDEQHFMRLEKDPAFILAESVNEDGLTWHEHGTTAPAAWALDYGRGRVCYLSPGHTIEVMRHPEYVKMQNNAVRWLLRK